MYLTPKNIVTLELVYTGKFGYRKSWFGKLILQAEYEIYRVSRPYNPYTEPQEKRTFLRKEYKDVSYRDMMEFNVFKLVKDKQ